MGIELRGILRLPMIRNGVVRQTSLPPEIPANIVVTPTMNRWGGNSPGPLPKAIHSVQKALHREDLGEETDAGE